VRAAKIFIFILWGTVISATPRLIRSQPETEVFFRDHNTSYVIPKDDGHNKTYELVEKAMKAKTKVSLRVDPKSRRVLGVEAQAPSEEAGKK
jgi:hypothetical protein